MSSSIALTKKSIAKIALFDVLAISFVYFVPALSHLLAFPLYLIEPMRIVVILSLIHTRHSNSYILAATLPIFSLLISGHPVFAKSAIIAAELLLNVWLFVFLSGKIKNTFISVFVSIALSKAAYYGLKFALLSFGAIDGSLISTPLWIQLITTTVLSGYVFIAGIFLNKKNNP